MTDAIEHVAMALARRDAEIAGNNDDAMWEHLEKRWQDDYRATAEVAINAFRQCAQQAPFPNESLESDIETSVRAILNFCSEDHSLERKTGYVRERIMRHVQRAPAAQEGPDREQIAALLFVTRYPMSIWSRASLAETEMAYKQADAILALNTTLAGKDDELERLRERCAGYKGQVEAGAAEIARLKAELAAKTS